MTIVDRIRRSVANRSDDVYLRGEFERFGSPAQVSRALATLIREGLLVRLGVGVYAKTKPSVLSGEPIPVRPLEVLAPQVLRKLGVPVRPRRLTRASNEGRSSQLPAADLASACVLLLSRRELAMRLTPGRPRGDAQQPAFSCAKCLGRYYADATTIGAASAAQQSRSHARSLRNPTI